MKYLPIYRTDLPSNHNEALSLPLQWTVFKQTRQFVSISALLLHAILVSIPLFIYGTLELPALPTDIIAYQIDLLFRWVPSRPQTSNTCARHCFSITPQTNRMCKGDEYFAIIDNVVELETHASMRYLKENFIRSLRVSKFRSVFVDVNGYRMIIVPKF